MANEITVRTSLQIRSTASELNYQSQPTSFRADMAGTRGPTPGSVVIATHGTSISFAQLTAMGGLCRLMNLDLTRFITYGILDTVTSKFYPLGELLPGESYVLRLSRELGNAYGTGSGTSGISDGDAFHMKAQYGSCVCLVEAFDP